MLLQDFQTQFTTKVKKGKFTHLKWCSSKTINGVEYKKVSSGKVRFVAYGNIKGVVVAGKVNTNEQCLIPSVLYYNTKTNNYYVQVATTNTKIANQKFYINGVETDKATYQTMVKPSNHNSPVFRIKLENLLELGK